MRTEAEIKMKVEERSTCRGCRQLLETGRGKEPVFPLEPPDGTQTCLHLDFDPVRPSLDF